MDRTHLSRSEHYWHSTAGQFDRHYQKSLILRIFLQKRRSNLKALVQDSLSLVAEFAEEYNVEIEADLQDIRVDADEERLPQAIAQLIRYFIGHRGN